MNKLSIFMNKNYKYKLALNTKFTTPQRVYSLSTRLVNAKPQQNSGKIKNVNKLSTFPHFNNYTFRLIFINFLCKMSIFILIHPNFKQVIHFSTIFFTHLPIIGICPKCTTICCGFCIKM